MKVVVAQVLSALVLLGCGGSDPATKVVTIDDLRGLLSDPVDGKLQESDVEHGIAGLKAYDLELTPDHPDPWVPDGTFQFVLAEPGTAAERELEAVGTIDDPSQDSREGPDEDGVIRTRDCDGDFCLDNASKRYGRNLVVQFSEAGPDSSKVFRELDARLEELID